VLRRLIELLDTTTARPPTQQGENVTYGGGEATLGFSGSSAFKFGGAIASPSTPWSRCESPSQFPAVPIVVYINTKPQRSGPAEFTPVCTKAWLDFV
jgi:predicted outer membrane repeat protein